MVFIFTSIVKRVPFLILVLLLTQCGKKENKPATVGSIDSNLSGQLDPSSDVAASTAALDAVPTTDLDTTEKQQAIQLGRDGVTSMSSAYALLRPNLPAAGIVAFHQAIRESREKLEAASKALKDAGFTALAYHFAKLAAKVPVLRLYKNGDFYYTISTQESDTAQKLAGYLYNGQGFRVFDQTKQVFEGCNRELRRCIYAKGHFTSLESNCEGQVFTGMLGRVCPVASATGSRELFRAWQASAGHHVTFFVEEFLIAQPYGFTLIGSQGFPPN